MRKLALAALAAIVLVCPAYAQQQTVSFTTPFTSGSLATITTDTVTLPISGAQWTTARFTVSSAGTATATAQISVDGGTNFIASAYAKRLTTASANPTVQAISATALTTGDSWEVPLPANATHFRLLCGATGTATTLSVFGGTTFVPGMQAVAVLYDVTSGVNAALDTGILDTSGWAGFAATYVTPAGGSGAVKGVDDAGANTASVTVPAAATVTGVFSPSGATATALGTAGTGAVAWRGKRTQFTSAAVAALTSRIRIEAWR